MRDAAIVCAVRVYVRVAMDRRASMGGLVPMRGHGPAEHAPEPRHACEMGCERARQRCVGEMTGGRNRRGWAAAGQRCTAWAHQCDDSVLMALAPEPACGALREVSEKSTKQRLR